MPRRLDWDCLDRWLLAANPGSKKTAADMTTAKKSSHLDGRQLVDANEEKEGLLQSLACWPKTYAKSEAKNNEKALTWQNDLGAPRV